MKFVTKLHHKHSNKPIWIAGSDPTLDDYPDDFLDDKIGIVLHLATLKFPDATYRYFNEYDRLEYLMKKDPSILKKKNIFAWPFYKRTKDESARLTKGTDRAYYLRLTPYPPNGDRNDIYREIGVKTMKDLVKKARMAETVKFGGYGTCTHACLYAAIMMGGNPINLIGNNHESKDGRDHFVKAEKIDVKERPEAADFSAPTRTPLMKKGTEAIIEGCKEINIKVNWLKNYEQALCLNQGL